MQSRFQNNSVIAILFLIFGILIGGVLKSIFTNPYTVTGIDDSHFIEMNSGLTNEKLQELQDALDRAYEEIAALKEELQNKKEGASTKSPSVAQSRFPDIEEKIQKIPAFMLKSQLGYFFDDESLDSLEDPHKFAQRALDIALSNDDIDSELNRATIEFSLSPIKGSRLIPPSAEVEQFDLIFAHVQLFGDSGEKPDNVMVKWQRVDTGEVLMFRNQRYNSNDALYVAHKPGKGWQTGIYRVNVYNMDDQVTPIGSNIFNISKVNTQDAATKGENSKMLEDLLLSGKATRKQ